MNIKKFPLLQRAKCAICGHTVFGVADDEPFMEDRSWFKVENQQARTVVYTDSIVTYIGKTDSLGNKIFEGDVVEFEMESLDTEGEYVYEHYVVMFSEKYCSFCLFNKKGVGQVEIVDFNCDSIKVKVIGNVYDNPELVEGWSEPKDVSL